MHSRVCTGGWEAAGWTATLRRRAGLTAGTNSSVGQERDLIANQAAHSLGSIRKRVASKARDVFIPRYVTLLRQRDQCCSPALGLLVNEHVEKL